MGDNAGTALPQDAAASLDKGKGKAVDPSVQDDVSMGEEGDSSDEESGVEDIPGDDEEDDRADDNLEPISADNIISGGRRTRGKSINFAEAAEKAQQAGDDPMDDDDDDEDFKAPAVDNDDVMKH